MAIAMLSEGLLGVSQMASVAAWAGWRSPHGGGDELCKIEKIAFPAAQVQGKAHWADRAVAARCQDFASAVSSKQ